MLTDLTVFAVSYARYRKWMDAGRCIALDNDEETEKLITDNYGLLRKLAKTMLLIRRRLYPRLSSLRISR